MNPEVIAATKLQIWQEIMRQQRYNHATDKYEAVDATTAATQAEEIFRRLCEPRTSGSKRAR